MLLAALVLAVSFGLGNPDATPAPIAAVAPHSQLPATVPGLSTDEGVFVVTRGDDDSDVIYFIAQNTRHSISPSDLQREWQLNPLWPARFVARDVVLGFPEGYPVGTARVGLLLAPVPEDAAEAPAIVAKDTPAAVSDVPAEAPAAEPPASLAYTVQPGDNLTRLSARNGTTVRAIVDANAIRNPNLIVIGQTLSIPTPQVAPEPAAQLAVPDLPVAADQPLPTPSASPSVSAPGPVASASAATPLAAVAAQTPVEAQTRSMLPVTQPGLSADEGVFLVTTGDDGTDVTYFIAQNARHSISPADLSLEQQLSSLRPVWRVERDVVLRFAEADPVGAARVGLLSATVADDPAAAAAETSQRYTVRAGDTLNRLSVRNGTTVQAIVDANAIRNPRLIYIGQRINIPNAEIP